MKPYLLNRAILVFLLIASQIPLKGIGQCLCEGGVTPDSVVQNQYFDSITAVNTTINFAQFDPTIGTLSCFKLNSTVTTVINFDLFNKEDTNVIYRFRTFREASFSGPGGFFDGISSTPVVYGPYDLDSVNPASTTDEVHIGPDTVFSSQYKESYYTGSGSYIGNGNVSFDYLNTSTVTLLQGSSNYDLFVRGYTRLNVQLVYYWCPAIILAANIKNFTAAKTSDHINLSWLVENEEPGNLYEVQVSNNGSRFKVINAFAAADNTPGTAAAYGYQYKLNQGASGKLYFRIRQKNAAGQVSYSAIRFINFDQDSNQPSITVYPNPVIREISMQFNKPQKGKYNVEIVNLTGQVLFRHTYTLNNTSSLEIDMPFNPPSGIYYLRGRNMATNELYTTKLIVKH